MPTNPLKVGITGGIGSGKSIVCKIFTVLGIPIYNADDRAKSLMTDNDGVVAKIREKFGTQSYHDDGSLNREYLAETIFSNSQMLQEINAIVHPEVATDFDYWVHDHADFPYIIKEAALLVDSGSYRNLDYLITVTAPVMLRIERVLQRDKLRTTSQVEVIISKQLEEEILISHSQFTITNDNRQLLVPQVTEIHEKLISLHHTG